MAAVARWRGAEFAGLASWVAWASLTSTALVLRFVSSGFGSSDVSPVKPWVGMSVPCSLPEQEMFAAASSVTVGDGCSAKFWLDSWMEDGAPFVLFPELFAVARRKRRSLYEAVTGQRWVLNLRGRISTDLLPAFVRLWQAVAALHLVEGTPDVFTWRVSENGSFTVASAYRMQFFGSSNSPLVGPIWQAWAPAKHRLLSWLIVQNRVLTADRLMAR